MTNSVVLLGAGGHALVLLDMLEQQNFEIKAVIAPVGLNEHSAFSSYIRHKKDEDVQRYATKDVYLVNGLGSLPKNSRRQELYCEMKGKGYRFLTLVSPAAIVSRYADLDEGVQVFSGAVIQAGARIGENTIINTSSSIDHGCQIGPHNHIAPSAGLSGDIKTGEAVHIASGAIITQGIKIGDRAIIGAGVSVVKDVPKFCKVLPDSPHFFIP